MELNKKFRNHFSIIIEKLWKYMLIIGLFLWDMISDLSVEETLAVMDNLIAALILVGILAVVTIYEILVWRKTWIVMDENAVVITSGRIQQKKKTISLANVANVNIQRNILETLFGTCKVKLDVNSSGNMASEMEIVLKVEKASALQAAIMSYVSQGKTAHVNMEAQEHEHESEACSKKDIFFHCLYSVTIWWLIAFIILLIPFASLFLPGESTEMPVGFWEILTLIVPVLGVIFTGIAGFLQYYKFTVYRVGDRIHISYGFFTRKMYQIPVHRIHSIEIVSPALGRMFGRAYAKMVCVGVGDEEKELSLLTLAMKQEDLWKKLKDLIPELLSEQDFKGAMHKQPSRAKIPFLVRYLIGMVILAASLAILYIIPGIPEIFYGWLFIVEILLQILWLVCTFLKYHTARWWLGEKQMIFTNGCMAKRMKMIPYKSVEHFEFHQGPLVRKMELFQAIFHVKGSGLRDSTTTCYMEETGKEMILEKIKKRGCRNND